jgi:hypothetical protein
MKKTSLEEQLRFVPNDTFGTEYFDGKPYITSEAFRILGNKGLEFIDKKIKQIIQNRIEIFGISEQGYHGFDTIASFIDFKNRVFIELDDYPTHHLFPEDEDIHTGETRIELERNAAKGDYLIRIEPCATNLIKDSSIENIIKFKFKKEYRNLPFLNNFDFE